MAVVTTMRPCGNMSFYYIELWAFLYGQPHWPPLLKKKLQITCSVKPGKSFAIWLNAHTETKVRLPTRQHCLTHHFHLNVIIVTCVVCQTRKFLRKTKGRLPMNKVARRLGIYVRRSVKILDPLKNRAPDLTRLAVTNENTRCS